ncbi:MAG: FFLEELY motif protein [Xanthobacteraceae bacterium]
MSVTEDPVSRLHRQLDLAAALRGSAATDAAAQSARQRLRSWQAVRLARTHADLLASKRTGPAASFFMTDLYGATDLSKLAADVRRVVPVMSKLLPTAGLETVADAIELDALSEALDAAMVAALGDKITALDAAAYGRAYRKVDRRNDRERQIALIEHLGQALGTLVRQPFVVSALKLMRKPAKVAGLGELQGFLERGYAAFRQIGDPKEFLEPIVSRERRLLKALFAGDDGLLDG